MAWFHLAAIPCVTRPNGRDSSLSKLVIVRSAPGRMLDHVDGGGDPGGTEGGGSGFGEDVGEGGVRFGSRVPDCEGNGGCACEIRIRDEPNSRGRIQEERPFRLDERDIDPGGRSIERILPMPVLIVDANQGDSSRHSINIMKDTTRTDKAVVHLIHAKSDIGLIGNRFGDCIKIDDGCGTYGR